LARFPTGIPGLDRLLHGGLLTESVVIVAGTPGTGKTTLGNHLAYIHAAAGGTAVFATAMAESHDRMLAHQRAFRFFDEALVGTRVQYLSVLDALLNGGLDGVVTLIRSVIREAGATLLVIDGVSVLEDLAPSPLEFRRFTHRLQVLSVLVGCTTLLLSNARPREVDRVGTHVDGILILRRSLAGTRGIRLLEVAKLRGSDHIDGRHEFDVTADGIVVYPRVEGVFAGSDPPADPPPDRLGLGISGFDAMVGDGLIAGSSTLLAGTPGAGKTLTGLHFAVEGARRGERALIAGFHESPERLARFARGVGLDLGRNLDAGLVRVLWRPPLEVSPDAWAWDVLAAIEAYGPRRLVVDAFTEVDRRLLDNDRASDYVAALTNALRAAGVTSLFVAELSSVVAPELRVPLPSASPAFDNLIVLRHFELRSRLRRVVSVLKIRESAFDPTIREFIIDETGITVGDAFEDAASILTGVAVPVRSVVS
jgi:circadian clock protein KaiC